MDRRLPGQRGGVSGKERKEPGQEAYTSFGLVHKFCKEKQHQDANILRAMFRKSPNNCEQLPQDVNRILRDVLRVSYEMAIGNINKKFSEELDNSKVVCKFASEIPQFVEACFHICWLMLMHDPPVVIQKNVTKGSPFDKGSYKPYMTTGDKIDYVVWPALLLHEDGPVIAKGVVECFRSTAYKQKTTCIKPEKQQVGYPEIDDAHARFDNNFDDID
ncbi:uncharacterized protein LOC128228820 [Mya arenaria]|uniref:uncharacterized protein LOC128228820 n=1 Tax=Mya arenaria TaxID=6604 RepID=UPI0022E39BFF|nr:uncharacterized protein LOC128228820 [Mya arenaria]XP_052796282.1 uncharacterized protein LOC128228820 [Mya arenaria]